MKKTLKNIILATAAAVLGLMMAGCAPGAVKYDANLVVDSEKYSEFTIGEAKGKYASELKSEVSKLLAEDFTPSANGLVVNLETVSSTEGSRMGRWFFGPLSSSNSHGKIVVRAEFLNREGEVIGEATATGKIVFGFFGGSFDNAINSAAKQIHSFAVKKFKH